jgi:hypothetical protein
MERSGIRGFVAPAAPDSASLHPGYCPSPFGATLAMTQPVQPAGIDANALRGVCFAPAIMPPATPRFYPAPCPMAFLTNKRKPV